MEFFRISRDIPFMRHALVFNIISLVTFVAAVIFLAVNGLNPPIGGRPRPPIWGRGPASRSR